MKRRDLIKGAGAGLLAGAFSSAGAADLPAIRWRLASSFPKSLDTIYGAGEVLVRRLEQITQGKFQIRVFAGGEIVPGLQVLDAVQNGTVECGHSASYYYVGKNMAFAFDTAMPFGLTARMQNSWMYSGGGLKLTRELFKDYNILNFLGGNTGVQMGGWFRKEIKSLADLKGLKMRIPGIGGQIMARLGAVPQTLAGGDIYQSLERGALDATEWVGPYDDEKLGFNRIVQYYYYPGWWEGNAMVVTLINETKWKELPKLYQIALTTACAEANLWSQSRYDAVNPAALRRLVAGGTKLRPFPKQVMEASETASYEVYGELMSKSAHWKRIYPAWKKFRDEQFLWFRVAEGSYDNYALYSRLGEGK
jgi:TRAP-type mannitol/chloroaromatic compound transport system substrate-binding protein